MTEDKIFIWPIGAEEPFVFDESKQPEKYLTEQLYAWRKERDIPSNAKSLISYSSENIRRIKYFRSLLPGLSAPSERQDLQTRDRIVSTARNQDAMWIDATSRAGKRLIDCLVKNDQKGFEQIQAEAHRDWDLRIKNLDAALSQSSIRSFKTPDRRAVALANALLGGSRDVEPSTEKAEVGSASNIEWLQAEIGKLVPQVRNLIDSNVRPAIESAVGSIDKKAEEIVAALRSAEAETIEKVGQARAEQALLVGQLSSKIENLKNTLANLTVSLDEKSESIPKIESELVRMATEIAAHIEASAASIRSHEQAHRGQLVLRAPIAYWSDKQVLHYWLAGAAFVSFVIVIASSALIVFFNFGSISTHLKEIQQSHGEGVFNLTGLAIISMPSVAFFWILKHISRVFVENLAQANDAGQRSVMMKTYLALVAEPTAKVSEPERLLVLNALFRPSAVSGSDDAPPSNLMDLLTKSADPKKP